MNVVRQQEERKGSKEAGEERTSGRVVGCCLESDPWVRSDCDRPRNFLGGLSGGSTAIITTITAPISSYSRQGKRNFLNFESVALGRV